MDEKFKVTEWLGGGEPIVTIACRKADWAEMVKAQSELAARDARIAELETALTKACQYVENGTGTCPNDEHGFYNDCVNCNNEILKCWQRYFIDSGKESSK